MTSTAAITADDGRSGLARRTTVVERPSASIPTTHLPKKHWKCWSVGVEHTLGM